MELLFLAFMHSHITYIGALPFDALFTELPGGQTAYLQNSRGGKQLIYRTPGGQTAYLQNSRGASRLPSKFLGAHC